MGSVRKSDLPLGCPSRGMETGKVVAEPDAFGVETAAGAEEVEAKLTLVGSGPKPGDRAVEVWKRDTPVTMPAGTGARGAPQRLEL